MSPRPEQVPVAKATEDSEHGEVAALEDIAAAAPMAPLGEEPVQRAPAPRVAVPPVPPPVEGIEDTEADLIIPEGDDEDLDELTLTSDEEFLFGETMRPDEVATAGAQHGDGPAFIRAPQEDERTFLSRVAKELMATGDPTARRFAERIASDMLGMKRLS